MMRSAYKTALQAFRNRKTKNQTMSQPHTLSIPMDLSLTIDAPGYPFGTVGTVEDIPAAAIREVLILAGDLHDAAAGRMPATLHLATGKMDRLSILGDVAEALYLVQRDADTIATALALGCRYGGDGGARFKLERRGTMSGLMLRMEFTAVRAEIETKG